MAYMSLDRERAATAWAQVKAVGEGVIGKYHSLARNFPTMVQSMGIGQTVGFLMARKEREEAAELLLSHVTAWLTDAKSPVPWSRTDQELIDRLVKESPQVWWSVEREAIEFGVWLKRFAEARVPRRRGDRNRGAAREAGTATEAEVTEAGPSEG